MRVLYAIQGTGNGHISRAREILPHLKKLANVDILVSGSQSDVQLGHDIKYNCKGIGFVFGKKGGIDYWRSLKELRTDLFLKEVIRLKVKKYDLIINDYEPVSAWSAYLKDVPCIALSHQSAFLSDKTPRPADEKKVAELLLRKYAPVNKAFAFHFQSYDDFIYTPVIRSEIRKLEPTNEGHYTVYLPAYSDKLLVTQLKKLKKTRWQVFSKHTKDFYTHDNITVMPVNNTLFNKSLASCAGLLTGGGFESPAEALYLQKKLMVIPMSGQYEQQCNAAALAKMGVSVLERFSELHIPAIKNWTEEETLVKTNYKDETASIIEQCLNFKY